MNNKGQSLIMFVLFLPILLLILFAIYDVGSMVLLRQELNNINYLAVDYALDNLDDTSVIDKTKAIIFKNKADVYNVDVNLNDDKIYVSFEGKIDNKISLVNKIKVFDIKTSYVGYFEEDKKIIERNK